MQGPIHLLTLSGSQLGSSSSAALLRAYEALVPSTFTVSHYDSLEALPVFQPQLDGSELPPEVADLREQIASADALVFSTPESSNGLPGPFQNALRWLVGSACVIGKRVALISVDCGSALAEEALNDTLRAMSASLIPGASAHLEIPSDRWNERAIIAQNHLRQAIFRSIDAISEAVGSGT
jgi:chromate reductase